MNPVFASLQPAAVWRHFDTLCRIPRPSKQEAALRTHLAQWAQAQGLHHEVDAAGNLLVRKPASPGCEDRPGVVLQGHLDMVCQANSGVAHDFSRDPITPLLQDGWLRAEGTTLGADNGIGVALTLAALEDRTLVHGPLEALFTVDEEAGMGGAQGLAPGVLQGSLMLNLDTEEWGEFYLGCAGGLDVNVDRPACAEPLPTGHLHRCIRLGGAARGALRHPHPRRARPCDQAAGARPARLGTCLQAASGEPARRHSPQRPAPRGLRHRGPAR